jgi:hypothetical protein
MLHLPVLFVGLDRGTRKSGKALSAESGLARRVTGKSIQLRLWSRLTGRTWLRPGFDPVFEDGLNFAWLRMNVDAYRRFHGVVPRDLTHVGMFAFSRGGSHLIESQFHLARCCFCFGEGSLDFRYDMNWRTFLCRGMYRTDSIQDKTACELTHLFYNCNSGPAHLDKEQWQERGSADYRRKWVLVLRNPLRILLSQHATGKKKWSLANASASKFLDWFERARAKFRDLLEKCPKNTHIISVEKFVAAPGPTLAEAAVHLEIDPDVVASRPMPIEFFRRLGRSGEVPILRGGYLRSPTRERAVMGWGGAFNPLAPLDVDRLYSEDLVAGLPADIRELFRRRLGARAMEFYMSDREHRFADVNTNNLLWL